MMKKLVSIFTIILFALNAMGAATWVSGTDVYTLYPSINLTGKSKLISGTVNPTSTATNGTVGSLYLNSSTGITYQKQDSGTTTNWLALASGTAASAATSQVWSGYYDNTCSWARSNTAYGDPTADTTCNLVQRQNVNFGTVTAYGGASTLPGIILTPNSTGIFYICASAKVTASSLSAILDMRLYDNLNSLELGSAEESDFIGSDQQFLPICGMFSGTASTPQTISLQTKSSAGSFTIQANSTNLSAIDWNVFKVSQTLPIPVIANSVITSDSGVERIERAVVAYGSACTTSPCTITSQSGTFLSSMTRTSAGTYTASFTTAFSGQPSCTIGVGTGAPIIGVTGLTTTGFSFNTYNLSGTLVDSANISLICQGPK